jgi:hypothetical protein
MLSICHRLVVALFMVLGTSGLIHAQVLQAIKYPGNGQLLVNGSVQVGISIQQVFSGPIVYQDRNTPATNAEGFVIMGIGRGVWANSSPSFTSINWSTGSYFEMENIDNIHSASLLI